jgi:hypothetical protein
MIELEFQQALARFLTDPVTRQAVLADDDGPPGTVAQTGDLASPEVVARLRALDRRRTAMFSQLLVVNRLTKVVDALPCTSWALGTRLWDVVQAYNLRCPPRHPKKHDEAMTFVGFLESTLPATPVGPRWLTDVLRYESSVVELRFLAEQPSPAGEGGPHQLGPENLDRIRPRRSVAVRVLEFDHNIEEILASFESGRPVPDLEPRPMMMLLQVLPDGTVRQDEVNLAVGELLGACSGELSLGAVVERLADRLGQRGQLDEFRAGCVSMCAELAARRVLFLD